MKPSGVTPMAQGGGGTERERLPKKKRTTSTKTIDKPNVTRIWSSLGRP